MKVSWRLRKVCHGGLCRLIRRFSGVGVGWHTLLPKVGVGWYVCCCCCRLGWVGIGLLEVEVDWDGVFRRLSKVYMEVGGWWRLLCRFARSWGRLTWRLKWKFAIECGQLRQRVNCWCMGRVEMGVGWKFGNDDMEFCWRLRYVGINDCYKLRFDEGRWVVEENSCLKVTENPAFFTFIAVCKSFWPNLMEFL